MFYPCVDKYRKKTMSGDIEYIVHSSKNGLLYDLTYFGNVVLIDKFMLQSKLNHTINDGDVCVVM